jgi:hypothetical protein
MRAKDTIKARMDQTAELLAIIKARLTMPGPDAKITLSAARNHGAKGNVPGYGFVVGHSGGRSDVL